MKNKNYCEYCGREMEINQFLYDKKTGKKTKTAILVCPLFYKVTSLHSGFVIKKIP